MYDAGLWTAKDAATNPLYPTQWKKTAVCANFQNPYGPLNVAEAQTQPPATDVYINTKSQVLKKYLKQSTVLHEALHNLTRSDDDDVEFLLGLPKTASQGKATDVINTTLVNNGSAAN